MKIIVLLLSISFQVFAKSDNVNKSMSQCEFFNTITMNSCFSLTIGIYGKKDINTKDSSSFMLLCSGATVFGHLKSGDKFISKWRSLSESDKMVFVYSTGSNVKKTTTQAEKLSMMNYFNKCSDGYKHTKEYKQIEKLSSKGSSETNNNLSFSQFKKMTTIGMPSGKIYSVYGILLKTGTHICEDNEYSRNLGCGPISEAVEIHEDLLNQEQRSNFYDLRGKFACFYVKSKDGAILINDFKLGQCKN